MRRRFRVDPKTGETYEVGEEARPESAPATIVRFRPFISYQYTKDAAKRMGAHRDAEGATHVTSEAQLNRYLAFEKSQGRPVYWKEH